MTSTLPRTPESYLPPLPVKKSFETPPPAFTAAREGGADHAEAPAAVPPPVAAPVAPPAPAPAPDPQAAAATMSGLTPLRRPVIHTDAPTNAPEVQPASAEHPLSPEEKKVLERAHKQEESAKAQAAKDAMKQIEIDRRKQKKDDERQAKEAREQAKRDREQAKRDAAAAKVEAKQAAEQAKRQAEIDRKQQKAVEEAEAKLKAAQKEYQTELAKTPKR